jgi:hypothetical protein
VPDLRVKKITDELAARVPLLRNAKFIKASRIFCVAGYKLDACSRCYSNISPNKKAGIIAKQFIGLWANCSGTIETIPWLAIVPISAAHRGLAHPIMVAVIRLTVCASVRGF